MGSVAGAGKAARLLVANRGVLAIQAADVALRYPNFFLAPPEDSSWRQQWGQL